MFLIFAVNLMNKNVLSLNLSKIFWKYKIKLNITNNFSDNLVTIVSDYPSLKEMTRSNLIVSIPPPEIFYSLSPSLFLSLSLSLFLSTITQGERQIKREGERKRDREREIEIEREMGCAPIENHRKYNDF